MSTLLGMRPGFLALVIGTIVAAIWPAVGYAAGTGIGSEPSLGNILPLWSVVPFVGILLSIALGPLVNAHWWEHNMGKVSLFWGIVFSVPFVLGYGLDVGLYNLLHIYVVDYIPFIVLLAGLFVIAGGIIIRGSLVGTPYFNAVILAIGAVLSSVIGTTGSSMLLIRPLIRANAFRRVKAHTIVFFIFLVSNIGGSLTPIGDPPLFLGFLHGVPFFWTLRIIAPFLVNCAILLVAYIAIDRYFYQRETMFTERGSINASTSNENAAKVSFGGLYNITFLLGVIAAVIFSGVFAQHPLFFDAPSGSAWGLPIMTSNGHTLVMPWINLARDLFIILMAVLSLKVTPRQLRADNHFTWGPIREVAVMFAGIFTTIIPALAILKARGGELGVTSPAQFFWAAGLLSSFLDNAPTYLTFASLAGSLGATVGVWTDLGIIDAEILLAISCGSVFMGANTYIGNAPNFMVRSIAEENGIKMPSFFGYMGWALALLIPLFVLDSWLFFM